jgi:hypothetical protein
MATLISEPFLSCRLASGRPIRTILCNLLLYSLQTVATHHKNIPDLPVAECSLSYRPAHIGLNSIRRLNQDFDRIQQGRRRGYLRWRPFLYH